MQSDWEPPHRFVAEIQDEMGPDDSMVATEWSIEPRRSGKSVVWVVQSWIVSGDDCGEQIEGQARGRIALFRMLRLYLTHVRVQSSAGFQVLVMGH